MVPYWLQEVKGKNLGSNKLLTIKFPPYKGTKAFFYLSTEEINSGFPFQMKQEANGFCRQRQSECTAPIRAENTQF